MPSVSVVWPFVGKPTRSVRTGPMSTRISGGSRRGRRLRSTKGAGLRPTSERVRSAIFSLVGPDTVRDARVLDLYSGTGALGIEALSRGASWSDFVEADGARCRSIRENLVDLGLDRQGHVYRARVERALETVDGEYGLVLIDPPYDLDQWDSVMTKLDSGNTLIDGALVVAEHRTTSTLAAGYGRLAAVTTRKYGDSSVSVYRLTEDA